LDGLTKEELQIFDIPFKGVSTRFGLRTIAKYIEKSGFYAPQTKILEGRTNRPEHLFDAIFNDS